MAAHGQNSTANPDESLEEYRARKAHAAAATTPAAKKIKKEPWASLIPFDALSKLRSDQQATTAPPTTPPTVTSGAAPAKSKDPWASLTKDYSTKYIKAHSNEPTVGADRTDEHTWQATGGTPPSTTTNTTTSAGTSTTASTNATTTNTASSKHEFPGTGDPALWKTATELSAEGRRADLIGDSDTAIAKLSKAVIIYQYDPQLYYYLGNLYLQRQTDDSKIKEANFDAAEICLRRALKLDRDLWYVWKNLGRISYERKSFPEAIYEYQHSIDCNAPASEISGEIKDYMEGAKDAIQDARKDAFVEVEAP